MFGQQGLELTAEFAAVAVEKLRAFPVSLGNFLSLFDLRAPVVFERCDREVAAQVAVFVDLVGILCSVDIIVSVSDTVVRIGRIADSVVAADITAQCGVES